MSASIGWNPVKPQKANWLNIGAGSNFADSMELPRTFDANDIAYLQGFKDASTHDKEAIQELIDAIYKHGTIKVFVEY